MVALIITDQVQSSSKVESGKCFRRFCPIIFLGLSWLSYFIGNNMIDYHPTIENGYGLLLLNEGI